MYKLIILVPFWSILSKLICLLKVQYLLYLLFIIKFYVMNSVLKGQRHYVLKENLHVT